MPYEHSFSSPVLPSCLFNCSCELGSSVTGKKGLIDTESEILIYPTPNVRERTLLDIEQDVHQMDSKYSVNFHSWVKSQQNVAHTSQFLLRFLAEYDEEKIAFGISWIISGWTLRASTELLLRSFSVWGIGHPKVGVILANVLERFESEYAKLELCSAIVAFEPAHNGASFFRHLTRTWKCHMAICTFIRYALRKLSWSELYFRAFMMHFCKITELESCPELTVVANQKRTEFVEKMLRDYDHSIAQEKQSQGKEERLEKQKHRENQPLVENGTTLKYFWYIFEEFVRETQCVIARSYAKHQ